MADFDAPIFTLAGLCEINLPDRDIRICDGAYLYVGPDKFTSEDEFFGSIASVEPITESIGDEAPAGKLTFVPASTAAAVELCQPEHQGSRMRFWFARVDPTAGAVMGDLELVADCILDVPTLRVSKRSRLLEMEFVGASERLFNVADGTVMTDRFHQSIWPGETGFANTTGVGKPVAWGTGSPPRSGSSGGIGGGGSFLNYAVRMQ